MRQSNTGFTLIELVIVLVIVSILAVVSTVKLLDFSSDAEDQHIQSTLVALEAGYSMVMADFYVQGSPGKGQNVHTVVDIAGIPVRFHDQEVRTTENSDHVPDVPQNRNANYTRLFFLFLNYAPGEIVKRDSTERGWAMLGNNARCASGDNPRRCWEYRNNGERVARITFMAGSGEFVVD